MRNVFGLVLAAVVILMGKPSFAMSPIPVDVKMTDGTKNSNGTYTDRSYTTFEQSETPYVWVRRTDNATDVLEMSGSWWHDPSEKITLVNTLASNATEALMTLDWNTTAKTPGNWTVDGFFVEPGGLVINDTGHYGSATTGFTFAPEPVSASLFLLGGLGLAMCRKNKTKV